MLGGRDFKAGPIRGWGLTAGFDWNTKNDAGYNSRKRMWVLGPTVSFDVPGFLNSGRARAVEEQRAVQRLPAELRGYHAARIRC